MKQNCIEFLLLLFRIILILILNFNNNNYYYGSDDGIAVAVNMLQGLSDEAFVSISSMLPTIFRMSNPVVAKSWWLHWRRCVVMFISSELYRFISPSPSLDNIRVMVIVWKLRGNIIRTALCWIVWHNVHSPQHTNVSISYRSNRLGLSHWDPYTVRRGGWLELYYCNMVQWFWWDSSLISTTAHRLN